MTDQQPMSPEPCEHHWIHYGQPSHSPIRWIVKCSQCNQFKIADLQEQVDVIEAAAEQRGAELALRDARGDWFKHADQMTHLPSKYYPGFWLKNCANQIEVRMPDQPHTPSTISVDEARTIWGHAVKAHRGDAGAMNALRVLLATHAPEWGNQ